MENFNGLNLYTASDIRVGNDRVLAVYIGNKKIWPERDFIPLTLESTGSGTITFLNKAQGPVYYRINAGTEQTISANSTKNITVSNHDIVQFWGNNNTYTRFEEMLTDPTQWTENDQYNIINSNISCNVDCYIYGNITSLISKTNFFNGIDIPEKLAFSELFQDNTHIISHPTKNLVLGAQFISEGCYFRTFYGCTKLTKTAISYAIGKAEKGTYYDNYTEQYVEYIYKNSSNLPYGCYQQMYRNCTSLSNIQFTKMRLGNYSASRMFSGCTSLIDASGLTIDNASNYGCDHMFEFCSSLTNAPKISGSYPGIYSYYGMFYNCTSLTNSPLISFYLPTGNCFRQMFFNCTNLNNVTFLCTDTSISASEWNEYTTQWLDGVSSTGTFTKKRGCTISAPNGWTVIEVD